MDDEKIQRAALLRLGGRTYQAIGDEMGVTKEMVRRYLRAAEAAGLELTFTVNHTSGVEAKDATRALRRYLDSVGFRVPVAADPERVSAEDAP